MTTKRKAQGATPRKADYAWNSFALTREETRELADELFNELADAPEETTLLLLALVNSLTYTRDHTRREHMRAEVKIALMPHLLAANNAADDGAAAAYRRLVGEGGEK